MHVYQDRRIDYCRIENTFVLHAAVDGDCNPTHHQECDGRIFFGKYAYLYYIIK